MEMKDLFNSLITKSKEMFNSQNFQQSYNQNYNPNIPQNPLSNAVQQLNWEYNQSLQTLNTQDVYQAEQSLMRATNAMRMLESNIPPNEALPYHIMFKQIDVTVNFVKGISLFTEERFQKALESFEKAEEICDKALEAFQMLHPGFRTNPNFSYMLPVLQNYFYYFDLMLEGNKAMLMGEIDKSENKFVDDYATFKKISDIFKKVNSIHFEQDYMNLGMAFMTKLNNFAKQLEIKAERLEEKRKKIQFMQPYDKKIFIVHGHDVAILFELQRLLKDKFHLNPIILNQEADKGKTIIEKFEHYARECAFAFVLVTPDDAVENNGKQYFQGRPNVLFELGWFSGRFGRDKVRIIRQKDTVLPSDLNGLISIDFQSALSEVYDKIHDDLVTSGVLED
ncbi:MAG: nucleotide-binding protein [Niabella sp.]